MGLEIKIGDIFDKYTGKNITLMQIHCVEEILPAGLTKDKAREGFMFGDATYGKFQYRMYYDGEHLIYETLHNR